MPLGSAELLRPSAMINVLVQSSIPAQVLNTPDVLSHWYGKSRKPGRKMGHINISAPTNEALAQKLESLAKVLPEEDYPGILKAATLLRS